MIGIVPWNGGLEMVRPSERCWAGQYLAIGTVYTLTALLCSREARLLQRPAVPVCANLPEVCQTNTGTGGHTEAPASTLVASQAVEMHTSMRGQTCHGTVIGDCDRVHAFIALVRPCTGRQRHGLGGNLGDESLLECRSIVMVRCGRWLSERQTKLCQLTWSLPLRRHPWQSYAWRPSIARQLRNLSRAFEQHLRALCRFPTNRHGHLFRYTLRGSPWQRKEIG